MARLRVSQQDTVSSEPILQNIPPGTLQWNEAKESDPDQNRSPEEVFQPQTAALSLSTREPPPQKFHSS